MKRKEKIETSDRQIESNRVNLTMPSKLTYFLHLPKLFNYLKPYHHNTWKIGTMPCHKLGIWLIHFCGEHCSYNFWLTVWLDLLLACLEAGLCAQRGRIKSDFCGGCCYYFDNLMYSWWYCFWRKKINVFYASYIQDTILATVLGIATT